MTLGRCWSGTVPSHFLLLGASGATSLDRLSHRRALVEKSGQEKRKARVFLLSLSDHLLGCSSSYGNAALSVVSVPSRQDHQELPLSFQLKQKPFLNPVVPHHPYLMSSCAHQLQKHVPVLNPSV